MKVLMVSRAINLFKYKVATFVYNQGVSLEKTGVDIDYFRIEGGSLKAYLKSIILLNKKLKRNKYDIVHSHYGFSCVIAVLQNKVPVVASFIGSDINNKLERLIAKLIIFRRSKYVIFVSKALQNKSGYKGDSSVFPYGISFEEFFPVDKNAALKKLGFSDKKINIFFAGVDGNWAKNFSLAKEAVELYAAKNGKEVNLIEFKNIAPEDLNYYYNACDLFLMTSVSEGSPQSIKEAMACNIPIVSTEVGDVKETIGDTEGCFLTSFEAEDVALKIQKALKFGKRTKGRESIKYLESNYIAKQIAEVYEHIMSSK
jgi:teichuronic acid biosynthesis glycosyltransferase TuaC